MIAGSNACSPPPRDANAVPTLGSQPDVAVLTNARLVLTDEVVRGSVAIRDGVIVDLGTGPVASPAEDLDGDYLIPGLVELHTDNLERHIQPRPGVQWPALAAVTAHDRHLVTHGITTVLDAVAAGDVHEGSARVRSFRAMLDALAVAQASDLLQADHHLHLRCELSFETVVDLFSTCIDDPRLRLRLVSLMDHTPGQRQYVDEEPYRAYYRDRYGLCDRTLDALIERQRATSTAVAAGHRRTIAAACAERGIAMASHDDTTADDVTAAAADGMVIAEFPTTVSAAAAARDQGLGIVMGAPNLVLGGSHSGNVATVTLAAAGLLDALSSDYVPSSLLLGASLLRRDPVGWSLPAAIRAITATPAALAGFTDRGTIATGCRADIVRVRHGTGGTPVVRGVWRQGRRVA